MAIATPMPPTAAPDSPNTCRRCVRRRRCYACAARWRAREGQGSRARRLLCAASDHGFRAARSRRVPGLGRAEYRRPAPGADWASRDARAAAAGRAPETARRSDGARRWSRSSTPRAWREGSGTRTEASHSRASIRSFPTLEPAPRRAGSGSWPARPGASRGGLPWCGWSRRSGSSRRGALARGAPMLTWARWSTWATRRRPPPWPPAPGAPSAPVPPRCARRGSRRGAPASAASASCAAPPLQWPAPWRPAPSRHCHRVRPEQYCRRRRRGRRQCR